MSDYRELQPTPALAEYLVCVWTRSTGGDGEEDLQPRILPDGCVDIVWIGDSAPAVAGPATLPVIADLPPRSHVVGVRFRPGMAARLLGTPASDLLNARVPLDDLWGAEVSRLLDRVDPSRPVESKLAALEAALLGRLPAADVSDALVVAAIEWFNQNPGGRVRDLAHQLDVGERHLLRRFRAAVGYGPKTLQRIGRLQRALALAGSYPPGKVNLAWLAAEAGYADQAHMTREFVQLTGVSPSALLPRARRASGLSDSFKTPSDPPHMLVGNGRSVA